jgi:predicted nucleotidyltransferase
MKNKLEATTISRNRELLKILEEQKYIKLTYLFGSVANGNQGKLSDVDIAVLLDDSLSKKERFDLQLKLIGDLSAILKTNNLDLIIMNDAPLSLRYEIIKANYPLFIRNEGEKIDFEAKILSAYLDRRYYEKRASDEFLKKVAETGL